MSKKVLITGVSGQDGSYMADYLLENTDYEIYGLVRRTSAPTYNHLTQALKNPRFKLVTGDLSDSQSIDKVVEKIKPDYFINLAAQSFVASSWELPEQTLDVNSSGVLRCLEAIVRHVPNCRFYNAGSSEQFGDVRYSPQDEKHPHRARSPYGASKISAHQIVKTYRESFNLYAIQGLLFNHESPRRGEEFVTRKITKGIARIKYAIDNNLPFEPIELGNLDAKRDWSHAKDFIEGIWLMLNQPILIKTDGVNHQLGTSCGEIIDYIPREYVLSSDETHSIREFIELAFKEAKIKEILDEKYGFGEFEWFNRGCSDKTKEHYKWSKSTDMGGGFPYFDFVFINPKFYRPADVELLLGDSTLARKELGWKPKYTFDTLVSEMVNEDIKNYKLS